VGEEGGGGGVLAAGDGGGEGVCAVGDGFVVRRRGGGREEGRGRGKGGFSRQIDRKHPIQRRKTNEKKKRS